MKYRAVTTPLALFLLLTSIYMVFYTGSYYTADEMAFVSMAESLLKEGNLTVDQLNWVEVGRDVSVGSYGTDGRLYTKVAPTQAFLITPLLWFAREMGQWGAVQFVFLLNSWLTALNGAVLLLLGRQWGYSDRRGVGVALLYGLATMALPYSKTLFAEPLSGLCLVSAFYLLSKPENKAWRVGLAGICLGVAGATRLTNFALAPLYGLYFLSVTRPGFLTLPTQPIKQATHWLAQQLWSLRHQILAFNLPIITAISLYVVYNTTRFETATQVGYGAGEGFRASVWNGLYILLLSPGKSLFLYVPLFILVIFLMKRFWRAHPAGALTLILLTPLQFLLLANWLGASGGWAWGPRLLMPLMPVWCIPLFLLPDWWRTSRRRKIAASLLISLSILSQLLGALVDYAESLRNLAAQGLISGERNVYSPALAAHRQHILMILEGKLDLAWLERIRLAPVSHVNWSIIIPVLLLVGLTAYLLHTTLTRSTTRPYLLGLALLGLGFVTHQTLQQAEQTRLVYRADVSNLTTILDEQNLPNSAILSTAVTHSQTLHNLYYGDLPVYTTRNLPYDDIPADELERLANYANRYRQLWLLMEWAPAGSPDNGLEWWLTSRYYPTQEWIFGGLRLVHYVNAPSTLPLSSPQTAQLGDSIRLLEHSVLSEQVWAGADLPLSLQWTTLAPLDENYTVFLQLLDENGQVVAQIDRQPVAGLHPTSAWQPNVPVRDNFALQIDPSLPPGRYTLITGLYTWPSLERLPVLDELGNPAGNHIPLRTITVLPPEN